MAIITQVKDLVTDAVAEALGIDEIETLDSNNIVSMGDQIKQSDKFDVFFGSLTNRIIKTRYFNRNYEGKDRKVLRDESEYGAFVRKVYITCPDFVDDAAYNIDSETGKFRQLSPYDVTATVEVDERIYGGQGTVSLEVVRPLQQVRTAFQSWEEMAGLVDSIYTVINNKMKKAEEVLTATAINTAIANTVNEGKNVVALRTKYNTLHSDAQIATAVECLENADFLNYAAREIYRIKENMKQLSVVYNPDGYETYTPEDKLVAEANTEFEGALIAILKANTFHENLIRMPGYSTIPFWQGSGDNYDFADCSKIAIQNDAFATQQNPDGEIEVENVVFVLRDEDAVAAYFGSRRTWEKYNERSDVAIHGEELKKGYAVDGHANIVVFTLN